jgi:hypothetical protein
MKESITFKENTIKITNSKNVNIGSIVSSGSFQKKQVESSKEIKKKNTHEKRSKNEKPLVFISHDSRDKDDLVRALARELSKLKCTVWYDEYSLKVGASLRESIESGLKETKNCIVVLSPNFLSNKGWGRVEFNSIFTREILEKQNVMLPVWHNVTVEQVYEYSPSLADKVGLNSKVGVEKLARKLVDEIKKN